jgi:hypothetical protein
LKGFAWRYFLSATGRESQVVAMIAVAIAQSIASEKKIAAGRAKPFSFGHW